MSPDPDQTHIKYDRIVVPTDGSAHADRAAEHGAQLARAFDATVHLITVTEPHGGPHRDDSDAPDTLDSARSHLQGVDRVQTAQLEGYPSEVILEYAADHEADLLAMGTHGRTGVHRYIAGSVTERVVRLAEVPVLTVRADEQSEETEAYDEILIPTDGSEYAAVAIDHAIGIAARFDARLHAVNIVDVGQFAATPDQGPPAEVMQQLRSVGEAATETVAAQASAAGVETVTRVQGGLPAKSLLDYTDDHDIDLIVMGTAGRTGATRYLFGSTTERIIRHAPEPVLAVNAPKQLENREYETR